MKKQLVFIFSLMLLPAAVFAYVHETLPSWHWAYEAVDELRLRGGFGELFSLSRPYTRGDVAEALIAIRKNEVENRLAFTPEDKRLYLRLVGEFMPEVEEIQGKADPALTVRLGARLAGGVNGSGETDAEYKGVYRTKTAVPLGKWGCAYNGTAFDQYKLDDPGYIGKRWRHITAYEEQAYVSARLK